VVHLVYTGQIHEFPKAIMVRALNAQKKGKENTRKLYLKLSKEALEISL
jgi:hypothetical protein